MKVFKNLCKKYQQGFTLVEMIVYTVFLTVFSVLISGAIISTSRIFTEFRVTRDINSTAITVMERVVREIRIAKDVDQVESTLGSNPGKLYLNTTDALGADTTVEFYIDSNRVRMEEDDVDFGFLSSANVNVDILLFNLVTNSNTEAVTVHLELSATRGTLTKTKSFYSTAILRGSY